MKDLLFSMDFIKHQKWVLLGAACQIDTAEYIETEKMGYAWEKTNQKTITNNKHNIPLNLIEHIKRFLLMTK